jgi:lysophospholipase L1-like esterase
MMRLCLLVACISGGLTSPGSPVRAAEPAKEFFFKPGDRIVFLGDSITEQYQYSTYLELYLTTRFPEGKFVFLNAGIGGDTASGGLNRFKAHVLDEKPTAVTINFGMNDGGYGKFNPAANKVFVEKTDAMLKLAKDAGVRVALCSPNAVDRRNKTNGREYLETQKQFYAPLKGLAEKYGYPFADQYAITRAAQERMEKDDPMAKTAKPYYDGFHTSPPGGMLMAHAILTSLNAPAVVSDVLVRVKTGGLALDSVRSEVTDLKGDATGVSFTRTDKSVPLPIQKDWLPMLPYTNELKDLNYYGLRVEGLKDGDYAVSIDGKEVGKFSSKELAAGVNLGNLTSGPIWEQGNKVFQAINAKNKIVHGRFRGILLGGDQYWATEPGLKRRPAELKQRLEEIEAAQVEVFKLAKPVARKFEVRPAK